MTLGPFDHASKTVVLEQHADDGPAVLARHQDDLLQRARGGQNTVDDAVNLAEPTQLSATRWDRPSFMDVYANPGTLVGTPLIGGFGGAAGAGGGRGGAGWRVCPGQMSTDGNSVFLVGTTDDKNPNDVGPKTFIPKDRNQDRR